MSLTLVCTVGLAGVYARLVFVVSFLGSVKAWDLELECAEGPLLQ